MVKWKRMILLLLGLLGSMVAIWTLQQSIIHTRTEDVFSPTQVMQTVEFPITISGTTLVAWQISAYEGPFLEDGSSKEVVDIAALHVYNAGHQEVNSACITMQMEQATYVFFGEHFPPGATVVLLEMNASAYLGGTILNCTGWQEVSDQAQLEGILVSDKDNGTLIVTNNTKDVLYNVHLYYKSWLSPPGFYMGGITYCITIPQLMPGQTEMLYPDRYATGYSKVVSIIADP